MPPVWLIVLVLVAFFLLAGILAALIVGPILERHAEALPKPTELHAGELIAEWRLVHPGELSSAAWRIDLEERLEQLAQAAELELKPYLRLHHRELLPWELEAYRSDTGIFLPPGTAIGLLEGRLR